MPPALDPEIALVMQPCLYSKQTELRRFSNIQLKSCKYILPLTTHICARPNILQIRINSQSEYISITPALWIKIYYKLKYSAKPNILQFNIFITNQNIFQINFTSHKPADSSSRWDLILFAGLWKDIWDHNWPCLISINSQIETKAM